MRSARPGRGRGKAAGVSGRRRAARPRSCGRFSCFSAVTFFCHHSLKHRGTEVTEEKKGEKTTKQLSVLCASVFRRFDRLISHFVRCFLEKSPTASGGPGEELTT